MILIFIFFKCYFDLVLILIKAWTWYNSSHDVTCPTRYNMQSVDTWPWHSSKLRPTLTSPHVIRAYPFPWVSEAFTSLSPRWHVSWVFSLIWNNKWRQPPLALLDSISLIQDRHWILRVRCRIDGIKSIGEESLTGIYCRLRARSRTVPTVPECSKGSYSGAAFIRGHQEGPVWGRSFTDAFKGERQGYVRVGTLNELRNEAKMIYITWQTTFFIQES